MIQIVNEMIPIKVSQIFGEDVKDYTYGKPHRYEIRAGDPLNYKILGDIHFQEGPYEEGINGITEDQWNNRNGPDGGHDRPIKKDSGD